MKKYNPSKALAARKRQIRRRRAAAVLIGVLIPLTAYSLTLTDYLNTAEVSPSSNQFEADGTNNFGQVQVTPNAELTIVKVVENDNGGLAGIGDCGLISLHSCEPVVVLCVGELSFAQSVDVRATSSQSF